MNFIATIFVLIITIFILFQDETSKEFLIKNYEKYSHEIMSIFEKNNLSTETDKAIEFADSLQEAIEEFEDSRVQINNEINQSTFLTMSDLEKISDSSLKKVVKNWAIRWDKVKNKFDTLNEYFGNVVHNSDGYFMQLFEIANKIHNQNLRQNELNHNDNLKRDWLQVLKQTKLNLTKLEDLMREGDDFHRVLLGASIREKLTENIDELKNISQKAEELLLEIEKLTQESKKLVY
jgi:hypothetical protein